MISGLPHTPGDKVKPTYENVYIGTFLFTLGYMFSAVSKGAKTAVGIELYQQTRKGEKTIGDLLTSVGGRNIIIEFKREFKEIAGEKTKASKKSLRDKLESFKDSNFNDISKRCHFLSVASEYSDSKKKCLAFLPYIDIIIKPATNHNWIGDGKFCLDYISTPSTEIGVDHEQFKYYVDQLTKVSNGTCGGLAVSIDAEGLRAAVVFDDIRDLQRSISEVELAAEREIQTLEKSIENEVNKTKSKGYER
ncbi:hypothetical protein P608_24695 [Comamonas thiooxydans]|jgi:hypothetical protein|uniref:Uncharacterized protein n=3 Tax=Comamonas TaxID=283 RepID=A0A0E3BNH5_9BURK|nr:hypothetical protein O987_14405 [Comamonas testosteroni TK102]KGH04215.1 hypothetical protein P608_24695 [Comamonas thiooxydans]KGH09933.1 hypothetical protein P607_26865 [Comamonas thiooxydans]KGH20232.1 hypothetical protein P606_21390 [Comamonas thiooxydans]